MSRYIDADAIKDKAWKAESEACFYALEDVVSVTDIDEAPSIDIVRCKECKYFIDNLTENDTDETYDACRWDWKRCIPKADDFCSYGEREGE